MKKKRIISFIAMFLIIFSLPVMAGAVEYAAEVNKAVKLRWSYKENSKYTLPVNNGLSSSHGGYSCVNNGIAKFNSEIAKYCSNIQVKSSAYSNSKVDLMIPGSSTWNTLGNYNISGTTTATTVPRSTSGTTYIGYNALPSSGTIYINYAMIWYNPSYATDMGGAYGTRTAMHEMSHVLGMGHYSGSSISNGTPGQTSTTLTSYDALQFRAMYP